MTSQLFVKQYINFCVEITDFGLARGVFKEMVNLTEYVVTRWYRAPEVMCSARQYDEKGKHRERQKKQQQLFFMKKLKKVNETFSIFFPPLYGKNDFSSPRSFKEISSNFLPK